MGSTNPITRSRRTANTIPLHTGTGGIVPLQNVTLFVLAILGSLLFILALCFAFLGNDEEADFFKAVLNDIETNDPGIVLIGGNVDIDISTSSVVISWSIAACGDNFELNGSSGILGTACGLPSTPLQIYVDNSPNPAVVYDPATIPFIRQTGQRHQIDKLVRFNTLHMLDIHNARLYPFDTYLLTTTFRAVDASNATVAIHKLSTIDLVPSFIVESTDMDSYETTLNGTQVPTRDIDLRVQRPGQARTFALVLFGVSWMLTHITIGNVILARRLVDTRSKIKHFFSAFVILLAIPQIRNSMPDGPGFDEGALIDYIGFFPQMIISAVSMLTLALLLMMHELDDINKIANTIMSPLPLARPNKPSSRRSTPASPRDSRPPLKPLVLGAKKARSSSIAMEYGEATSLNEDINNSFVFPHACSPSSANPNRTIHHRSRSSRTFFGSAGVCDPHLSRSNTLKSVREI